MRMDTENMLDYCKQRIYMLFLRSSGFMFFPGAYFLVHRKNMIRNREQKKNEKNEDTKYTRDKMLFSNNVVNFLT